MNKVNFFYLEKQLKIGIVFQSTFKYRKILISFVGAFIAINILAVVCMCNDQSLLISPFGASAVLIFGVEESSLSQPRNLIMDNLLGAISAIFSFSFFVNNYFSWGIAVAIAITFGQLFRCLQPPAGADALLGVIFNADLNFILSPV